MDEAGASMRSAFLASNTAVMRNATPMRPIPGTSVQSDWATPATIHSDLASLWYSRSQAAAAAAAQPSSANADPGSSRRPTVGFLVPRSYLMSSSSSAAGVVSQLDSSASLSLPAAHQPQQRFIPPPQQQRFIPPPQQQRFIPRQATAMPAVAAHPATSQLSMVGRSYVVPPTGGLASVPSVAAAMGSIGARSAAVGHQVLAGEPANRFYIIRPRHLVPGAAVVPSPVRLQQTPALRRPLAGAMANPDLGRSQQM